MTIEEILARNVDALMRAHPEWDSQQRLSKASGVGQTSVGRMRRADGSATIDNVQKVAKVFKYQATDLLDPLLLKRIGQSAAPQDERSKAAEIAAEIEKSGFTLAQLAILDNTIAALKASK